MACLKFFKLANVDFVEEWKGHWGHSLTQPDDTSYSEFSQIAYRRLLYYQSSLYFASCIPVIVQGYEHSNIRRRQSPRRTYIGRNPAPPFTGIDRSDVLEWNYHISYWFTMSLGDASRVDNRQNIAAGSLYRCLCNTRIEFEAVDT